MPPEVHSSERKEGPFVLQLHLRQHDFDRQREGIPGDLQNRIKVVVSGDKNMVPLEVAILAAFLFYRYKFLSRTKDKNLYRLP